MRAPLHAQVEWQATLRTLDGAQALVASRLSGPGGRTGWPGIHWMGMEDEMELMELWMGNVRGWDEIRASHDDLLSV